MVVSNQSPEPGALVESDEEPTMPLSAVDSKRKAILTDSSSRKEGDTVTAENETDSNLGDLELLTAEGPATATAAGTAAAAVAVFFKTKH